MSGSPLSTPLWAWAMIQRDLGRYDLAKSVPNLIYLHSPVAILFFTCHLMNLMGADKIPTSP